MELERRNWFIETKIGELLFVELSNKKFNDEEKSLPKSLMMKLLKGKILVNNRINLSGKCFAKRYCINLWVLRGKEN